MATTAISNELHIAEDYWERVYAGWLGKAIGVRHGGNIEGWTYDRIERTFGEITTYLHEFKNFAADDDTNGPMFFLRALEDYTHTRDITPEQMGLGWLNYAPDGHGFYWWGGYGKSTEHTAYLNLKNGVMAPRSGSIEQNGAAVAEQIGGQIFIDVWGMIAPGNPRLAAEYAEKIASVSHDGNGKYGGMFIAAAIAAAFVESDIQAILEAGLSVIPTDCEFALMTRDVMAYHGERPGDWRSCFAFVREKYGYQHYPGVCHIIPNAAVIVLSLLYGEGDFSRAINICNMCGWDTDCNVANVGAIMGVRGGLDAIDSSWREPINDFLCCSSVIGSLNQLDMPWCAAYIAQFGYKIAGLPLPDAIRGVLEGTAPRYHFELPGSTHAFRTGCDDTANIASYVRNTTEAAYSGRRSLKAMFDRTTGGLAYRVYLKTYYRPSDFNDSRYDPSFSPICYPGQSIEAAVMLPAHSETAIAARLYALDGNSGIRHYANNVTLAPGEWMKLTFDLPRMNGACIEEIGVELVPKSGFNQPLVCYIDDVGISGLADYELDFAKERLEEWNGLHIEVSQFSYLRGLWTLAGGRLVGSYYGEPAECYTGLLDWSDYEFAATVVPQLGSEHRVLFRVQGGIRSYAAGFSSGGTFRLFKNDNGYRVIAEAPFEWEPGVEYEIRIVAEGSRLQASVNGQPLIDFADADSPYLTGMIGFSNSDASRTSYRGFSLRGLA